MSKILVVDDDEAVQQMLSRQLKASGYDVALAFDSTSTMRVAREEAPDLILLDLGLPAGDGFLLMEELKADTYTASIPVIVLTGRDAEGNQERAYETGAADFFQKPFHSAWLLRAIEGALAEHSEKESELAISS
jgi:DNA-binding response OmpR family regulator